MSLTSDFRREMQFNIRRLKDALKPINSSLQFCVYKGTSIHDAVPDTENTPNDLKSLGGWYDKLSGQLDKTKEINHHAIKVKLTPQQVAPLQSKSQLLTLIGAQRSGKSRVGFFLAIRGAIEKPGSNILYLVPTFNKVNIIVELVNEYLGNFITRQNLAKHEFTLMNQSTLKIFTIAGGQASIPNEAFLGFSANQIILEEYREFPHAKQVFESAFSRTINTGGSLIIVSSPETNHHLEDIVVGGALEADMDIFYLSALDNFLGKFDAENPNAIFEKAKRIYPTNKFKRDVLGEFVAGDDIDYNEFDRDIHKIDKVPGVPVTHLIWQSDFWLQRRIGYAQDSAKVLPNPTQKMPIILGLDFGRNVISGVVLRATLDKLTMPYPQDINYESLHITVVHELVQKHTNLIKYIDEVLFRYFRDPRQVAIFCDPAGIKKSELDGRSMVGTLKKKGFIVFCPTTYPPRQQAVDTVNMRFKLRRLHVLSGCTQTIASLMKFKSDGRAQKDLSRDPYGHLCDALKYPITCLFPWIDLLRPENKNHLNSLAEAYRSDEGIIK